MKILAIESSCDETAAAVVEDGVKILSNVVVSQVDIFAAYGGVIPEVAARSHLEAILPVIEKAMKDAELTKDDIDAIAVTHTPGLLGSLLIGTLTARMLAILWGKPLYAVHHLKSHIYANWLNTGSREEKTLSFSGHDVGSARRYGRATSSSSLVSSGDSRKAQCLSVRQPEFPLLALVVSGGHTQIIYMRGHNQFEIVGTTRDDAVGECFDKVAKILGLPYPGGPSIAKAAGGQDVMLSSDAVSLSKSNPPAEGRDFDPAQPKRSPQTAQHLVRFPVGNPRAYKLPHPQVEGLDFSFSGLKTAVLRAVQAECGLPITTPSYELKNHLTKQQVADFAASFQETACDILVEKLEMALKDHQEAKSLVVAGGVSASAALRKKVTERFSEASGGKLKVYFPALKFAGDNAAMVSAAAYFEVISGVKPTNPYTLSIAPRTAISAK